MFSALRRPRMMELARVQMSKFSSYTKYKSLTVTVPKPFVVHVELNRPDRLNTMDRVMWMELGQCFKFLSLNPDCRVVVISGAGLKLFSAGIDLNDMMAVISEVAQQEDIARKSRVLWKYIKMFQESISAIEKCNKPVIAAIHGACIGGALSLICATDIRYCTADAWFQNKEVDIGMVADVGTLQRMPKLMGSRSLVNELAFTCRKLHAAEAKERGFVSQVFDSMDRLMATTIETAAIIASKSPVAVQGTKRSLIYSRDHTVEEGLENVALHNMSMLQSEDFINAMAAQTSKQQAPTFSKL